MLKSSINKSDLHWVSSGLKKQFEENLEKSLSLFDGNYKKTVSNKKINADLVPVGHFLNYIPKFYHPSDGWFESPEYLEPQEQFVENEIIVGTVLQALFESISLLLRGIVEKRTALENLDLILLSIDEIVEPSITVKAVGHQ